MASGSRSREALSGPASIGSKPRSATRSITTGLRALSSPATNIGVLVLNDGSERGVALDLVVKSQGQRFDRRQSAGPFGQAWNVDVCHAGLDQRDHSTPVSA